MAFIAPRTYSSDRVKLIIQSALPSDAREILLMIQQAESETDFLTRIPGEFPMTVENECKYIEDKLSSSKEIFLIARYNDRIVGTLGFTASPLARCRHKGQMGISVLRGFWGLGIGRKLIETLLEWADSIAIVKITLEVDTLNQRAINLYKSLGFFEEGYLKMDRLMETNEFRDSYIMARFNPYFSSL